MGMKLLQVPLLAVFISFLQKIVAGSDFITDDFISVGR